MMLKICQHWLRWWMAWCRMAPSHITWTNVDSSMWFSGIYLRAISEEILRISICKINLKITLLKLLRHIPGAYLGSQFVTIHQSICFLFRNWRKSVTVSSSEMVNVRLTLFSCMARQRILRRRNDGRHLSRISRKRAWSSSTRIRRSVCLYHLPLPYITDWWVSARLQ